MKNKEKINADELKEKEECCCNSKCNCEEECNCNEKEEKKEKKKKDKNNKEIEELNKKISLLEEALLREKAEVQNYKRRTEAEMDRILKYKNEDIIKEYLPIIDNFERAIKMDDRDLSDEVSKFLEGFKIIYTNTLNLLNKFDVKVIDAEGVEFDPVYHHAVLTEHDESKPKGVVLEVLQKGYIYKDRVVRPSMVKVNE